MLPSYASSWRQLRPVVRSRWSFESLILEVQRRQPVEGDSRPAFRVIGDHLAVGLALDDGTMRRWVRREDLKEWQVDFDTALTAARDNAAKLELHWSVVREGCYVADGAGDDYTSLLLDGDAIHRLQLAGSPVVAAPDPTTIVLTGADNYDGLGAVHLVARDKFGETDRRISARPYQWRGPSGWSPWLPAHPSHPLFPEFRQLHVLEDFTIYGAQQVALRNLFQEQEKDLFVASFKVHEEPLPGRDDAARVYSHCTWTEGCVSWLPMTDWVVYVTSAHIGRSDKREQALGPPTVVAWSDVQKQFGKMLQRLDVYPPRFEVRVFPTSNQLSQSPSLPYPFAEEESGGVESGQPTHSPSAPAAKNLQDAKSTHRGSLKGWSVLVVLALALVGLPCIAGGALLAVFYRQDTVRSQEAIRSGRPIVAARELNSLGPIIPSRPTMPETTIADAPQLTDVVNWRLELDPPDGLFRLPDGFGISRELPRGYEVVHPCQPSPLICLLRREAGAIAFEIWDLAQNQQVRSGRTEPHNWSEPWRFSAGGNVLTARSENQLRVWSLTEGRGLATMGDFREAALRKCGFIDDQRMFLVTQRFARTAEVSVVLTATGQTLWSQEVGMHVIENVHAVSPGGRYLAFANRAAEEIQLRVYDTRDGALVGRRDLPGPRSSFYLPCRGLAFSRSGDSLGVLLTQNGSRLGGRIVCIGTFGDVEQDHRFDQPLETFGLSREAAGLQWLADDSGWFVCEQWLIDKQTGQVLGEPLGAIEGLSRYRRVLVDGKYVIHVEKGPSFHRVLRSRPLEWSATDES